MQDNYKIAEPEDMIVHKEVEVIHPGSMIRGGIEAKGLTIAEAASQAGIPVEQLTRIADGLAPVDVQVAEALGRLFGAGFGEFVYRWQMRHDEAVQRPQDAHRGPKRTSGTTDSPAPL